MLVIEADIHEYVGMSYVDENILGPLVHMYVGKSDRGRLGFTELSQTTVTRLVFTLFMVKQTVSTAR